MIFQTKKTDQVFRFWMCKKCGLVRANNHTHKHGDVLPKDILDMINQILESKIKEEVDKDGKQSGSKTET